MTYGLIDLGRWRRMRITLVLLSLSTIALTITSITAVHVASQWRDHALVAAANFERCRTLRVPPARPGAQITAR
jgi:hypothetical protein